MALSYPANEEDRIGQAVVQMQLLNEDDQLQQQDLSERVRGLTDTNTIRIYIPGGISIPDNVAYGDTDLGVLGSLVLGGIDAVNEQAVPLEDANDEAKKSFLTNIGDKTGIDKDALGSIITYAALGTAGAAAGSVLGGLTGSALGAAVAGSANSVQGAIGLGTRRIINPNTKATFQGVSLRKFGFTFNMIPTSEGEANQIDRIIKALRTQMYPERVGTGNFSAFLKYPKKVRVSIRTSAEEDGTNDIKFKDCFITSVNRSLNPTSNIFHRDGHPTEVALSVAFSEDSILSSEDVRRGF